MVDTNSNIQNNNADEEFEYIELEEGQELPEGYEYEYIEVPADDVSEMDVVNRPHLFDHGTSEDDDDDDMASISEIDATLKSSQEEEPKNEAPFPSFLQAPIEETSAPSDDNRQSFENVSPQNMAEEENVNFINTANGADNWQEDTRATYDLDAVKADDSELKFQENTVSSIDVNDYIEPEATYAPKDVAVTEIPDPHANVEYNVAVEDVAEQNVVVPEEENVSMDDDMLALDNDDISLDELLQDEDGSVGSEHLANAVDDMSELLPQEAETGEENFISETVPEPEIVTAPVDEIILPDENVVTENVSVAENIEAPVVDENVVDVPHEEVFIAEEKAYVPETGVTESVSLQDDVVADDVVDNEVISEVQPIELSAENESTENEVENDLSENREKSADVEENVVAEEVPVYTQNVNEDVWQEETVVHSDNEAEQLNPSLLTFETTNYGADEIAKAELSSRLVSKKDGIQSFKADENISDILLTDVDFAQNELKSWNLVLYQQSLLPLQKKVAELNVPVRPLVNRYATVVQGGNKKTSLYNEEHLKIINASHACVAVNGKFICGDFEANSGVVIDDFMPVSLVDFAGKKLTFNAPSSGFLTGPEGCIVFFFNLKNLWVPNADVAAVDAEKLQYKISKWYSGTLHDKYFEFSAQSESSEFVGNEEVNAIHVNVNNSSYGWNVTFDNGLSMNLRDLREYQTRFGKIPSPNGEITYGQKSLKFQNVERIVVYEAAQYFFYS